ncbi:MAG: L-lactate permease [Synergistaceae bacterium]|jgi:lactate permease|nr:L-lactate permease [Synergistaceae bacterium]
MIASEIFRFGMATFPIVLLVVTLMIFKLRVTLASFISLVASMLIGTLCFGEKPIEIPLQMLKGVWDALGIFMVICPAMLIYQILSEAKMFYHIQKRVEHLIKDELLRVLFSGWAFACFLQSVTGFGIPVAICAPILVSFGFSPVISVIISILGHAWGGTFGTLAVAWDSLVIQSKMTDLAMITQTAINASLMIWAYNLVCGFVIYALYKKHKGSRNINPQEIFFVIVISTVQGGGQLLVAYFNPSVACFVSSALSIAVIFFLDFVSSKKQHKTKKEEQKHTVPLFDIVMPYVILIILVVGLLLVGSVNSFLAQFKIGFKLPQTAAGIELSIYSPISIFTHSGTILLITSVILYVWYLKKEYVKYSNLRHTIQKALKKSSQSILPVMFLIIMSKVMDGTGQITIMANVIAGFFKRTYPLVAPFVGIIGSFICSSNMSSNILFTGFQNNIALKLHMDPTVILAAQTAGGSIGNLLATSNIVLGLITTKASGQESNVLKFLFPIAFLVGILCGVLSLLLSQKGGY